MWHWLGILLVISGTLSLIFNEFTMQLRRVWPWRRDDSDPVRDAALNEFHRLSVYAGSIASIEIGGMLAEASLPHLGIRSVGYLGFGAWLLWRRPALRTRTLWRSLARGGKGGPSA